MENSIDTGTQPAGYKAKALLALLALLLLSSWVYWPGLTGPLLLDDYRNLTPLDAGGGVTDLESLLTFVFGNTSGPTGRPVSMLSFLIDAQSWPPLVASFKYTNIMIHLLCGLVLFWLCLLLFRHFLPASRNNTWLALLVCALWLLHPLNVSTTLYVVQRMTQLMTLFALASLLCYVAGRICLSDRPRQSLLLLLMALFPFGLLSVLSKENGALLLLLIVIMEATLFAAAPKTKWFTIWFRLGVALPIVIMAAYLLYSFPDAAANYDIRSFSLDERLLTQLRIVSMYIFEIMLPNTLDAGLFHDDIQVSTSLFNPLSAVVSALFIGALLLSAFAFRRKQPMYSFAVLWFFAMQLLESTYMPLELYFEHRNYMAMIGPLVATVWYLSSTVQQLQVPNPGQLLSAASILLLAFMAWLTWGACPAVE